MAKNAVRVPNVVIISACLCLVAVSATQDEQAPHFSCTAGLSHLCPIVTEAGEQQQHCDEMAKHVDTTCKLFGEDICKAATARHQSMCKNPDDRWRLLNGPDEPKDDPRSSAVAGPSSKAGGIHARVTVTTDTVMGEDDSEGFSSSNNKIDLETDFECPTSDDPNDWIETLEVNTVDNGDNGEDYLSSGETYKPVHFTIKQGTNRRRASLGHRRRAAYVYYEGSPSKRLANSGFFPSTLRVMEDINDEKDYFNGKLMKTGDIKRVGGDGEESQWYEINDGACYAMAAYIKTGVRENQRFRRGSSEHFLKEVHLRVLKFAVCKNVNGEPLCASKKNVVSCWMKKNNGNWERCGDGDKPLLTAAILART